jgi:hypothetical protein
MNRPIHVTVGNHSGPHSTRGLEQYETPPCAIEALLQIDSTTGSADHYADTSYASRSCRHAPESCSLGEGKSTPAFCDETSVDELPGNLSVQRSSEAIELRSARLPNPDRNELCRKLDFVTKAIGIVSRS